MASPGAALEGSRGASLHGEAPGRSAARTLLASADLIAMAALLALAFLALMAMRVATVGLYSDDVSYAIGARELAVSGHYSLPVMAHEHMRLRFPIGFSYLLSLFWKAGGQNVGVVGVWEVVVVTLAVGFLMLAYALLTRTWRLNRLACALAVLAIAFHPLMMKYGSSVMSDLPFAFFALVAIAGIEGLRRLTPAGAPWRYPLLTLVTSLLLAWAILVRYAGVTALAAGFVTLWLEGRRKTAVGLGVLTSVWLAPWIWWVHLHGATGYVDDVQRNSRGVGLLAVLGRGVHWLGVQSLPGLLVPVPFLGGILGIGTFKPTGAPIEGIGWVLFAGLLGAGFVAVTRRQTRLAALYPLFTVALVGAWSGAFPTLGWDLQVRLLLPVAPLLLAFLFDAVQAQILALTGASAASSPVDGTLQGKAFATFRAQLRSSLPAAGASLRGGKAPSQVTAGEAGGSKFLFRRTVLFVVSVGILAWVARVDFQADSYRHAYAVALSRTTAGLSTVGAYLARVPANVEVGATYPLQAFFYAPRRYLQVIVTPDGLRQARAQGVKLVLAQPFYYGAHDYTLKSVDKLVKEHQAQVLFVASDHIAVVRLLPLPKRRKT